jgi:hypothetical protein
MSLHASHVAATVGAAFLLTATISPPASAMLAPFDPVPVTVADLGTDLATPHCFMGHETWPATVQPQQPCTS